MDEEKNSTEDWPDVLRSREVEQEVLDILDGKSEARQG